MRTIDATPVRRAYVDGRHGQVHLRRCDGPGAASPRPTLVCLHATAYSGQTFVPLMHALAPSRAVIAIDTPGYGGSDAPADRPSFGAYAEALSEAIVCSGAAQRGPVDLFGHHTGAMLAVEIAVQSPGLVRRLVLSGVPYFTGSSKAEWRARLVRETELTESFDPIRSRWDHFIEGRTPGLSLARAFDCFVDELRAYPREWWAHHALFDYDAAPRLASVRQPVCILNFATALAGPSRDAAAVLSDARVIELPQLGGAPFDLGAALLAEQIDGFLDAKDGG